MMMMDNLDCKRRKKIVLKGRKYRSKGLKKNQRDRQVMTDKMKNHGYRQDERPKK
jgi:hypothetical protein